MFTVFLILVLSSISSSSASTCECNCCAGYSCKPTLQGTMSVDPCSFCKSVCMAIYPLACTDGLGTTIYRCGGVDTNSSPPPSLITGGSVPNWFGTFRAENKCDQNSCCCFTGLMNLTRLGTNKLRFQSKLVGSCQQYPSAVDEEYPLPDGFTTTVLFGGQRIITNLSMDSRKIHFTNQIFRECSDSAVRASAVSNSINMTFVLALTTLVLFKQLVISQ